MHLAEINEILSRASNVIEALYLFGVHGEKKKASINRLFFEDIRKYYPQLHSNLKSRTRPGPGSISHKVLLKGQQEGIFREDINVEVVDIFIHYMMQALHDREVFPANISDKEILWNAIIPYYNGICTDKGRQLIKDHIPLLFS